MSKDKVALIIGAGDYLGSAIARRFAKRGFTLLARAEGVILSVSSRKLKIPAAKPPASTATHVKRNSG